MRIVRSALVVPAACLVALLTLGGCSDSDDGDDNAAATSTTAPAATTSTRTVDTRFTGEGSAEFCEFITAFTDSQQGVSASAAPEALEAAFAKSLDSIDQAVEVAPPEIKPDVMRISDTFKTVQAAAAAVDFNVTNMSAADLGALQNEQFLDSVTRLQAYLTNVCRAAG